MILCIVLPNEDLHPTDRWFEDYTALKRAVDKAPEDFEPNTTYVLITPSKTLTTHPQTRLAFDVVSAPFPGCEKPGTEKPARKPRAKKEPAADTIPSGRDTMRRLMTQKEPQARGVEKPDVEKPDVERPVGDGLGIMPKLTDKGKKEEA